VADFDTLQAHLERGELQSALALYRGELLPGSQVASLREYGAYLLEALRQAVIADRNLEGCLQLLDTNPDDLELLELALELAGKGDPRRPLVQAQATLLRREWGL
jgi:hypothetical protein